MTDDDARNALEQMADATNDGDSEEFLACFTTDGVIDDWGRRFVGPEAIAGWDARENIGSKSHIELVDVVPDAAMFTMTVRVSGDGYNGGGTFAVETRDGLISRLVIRG
jgi:phenylacetic acid degradation operon negative regulatory protein